MERHPVAHERARPLLGLCAVCRRRITLYANNLLRWHTRTGARWQGACPGSHRPPLVVVVVEVPVR